MSDWLQDLSMGNLSFGHMVLRLAMATILGGLIGLERERLDRAAGLRTHALVSVGSALIMIVSAYGFPDPDGAAAAGLDPSRIAAQVVSGIGFLGALVIQAGLKPVERKLFPRHDRRHRVLMRIDGGTDTLSAVELALEGTSVRLQSLELDRVSGASHEMLELTLIANSREDVFDLITVLSQAPAVQRITYGRRSSRLRRQERGIDLDEDDEDGGA